MHPVSCVTLRVSKLRSQDHYVGATDGRNLRWFQDKLRTDHCCHPFAVRIQPAIPTKLETPKQ